MVSGTVKSEPGFEPALDAVLNGVGYDYIHNDADGANMRLDVRSQVKYVLVASSVSVPMGVCGAYGGKERGARDGLSFERAD